VAAEETTEEESGALFADQLKGHVPDHLAVVLGEAAEKFAGAGRISRIRRSCPLATLIGGALGERGHLGRRFPVVKQLVHGNFESRAIFCSVSMLGTVWPFSTRET
jgi:hypothetical protein